MKRLVVLVLVLLLVSASAATAFAAEQTITVSVKLSTPVFAGKTALGSLVIKSPSPGADVSWSFTGTVDGKPASASGVATCRWTGNSYEGSITRVDTWDMGGIPQPKLPLAMSFFAGTNQTVDAVVATKQAGNVSTPLAYQGVDKLPIATEGNVALSVTNVAGAQVVTRLPRTGDAPEWLNLLALAALMLGLGAFGTSRIMLRRVA